MSKDLKINTVLGEIRLDDLGKTLIHEHIACAGPGYEMDSSFHFDEVSGINLIIEELECLKKYGVSSIVDASTVDLGRNINYQFQIAERTGINIIAATGFYRENFGLPYYFQNKAVDELAEFIIKELEIGIGQKDIKAGIIKVATSANQITETEEKVLKAAVIAHKETRAPIITHTELGTMGKEQLEIFEMEGVNLHQVCIGHSDCCSDLKYHLDLIKRGAFVGFDRIGLKVYGSDEIRLAAIAGLVAAGHERQLLLSQDVVGIYPGARLPDFSLPIRSYLHLFKNFIPRLIKSGVSSIAIDTMLIENPKALFQGF